MKYVTRLASVVVVASLFLTCYDGPLIRSQARGETFIPFTFTAHNNIVVKAILNQTDVFDLMFHTAASDLELTEDAVRKSTSVKFKGVAEVGSWGGRSNSRWSPGNHLQIGELLWDKIVVWEDKHSGIGTDGKIGFDLFKGRVLEIDFDQQRLAVYDQLPAKAKQYQKLKLANENGNLFVEASCVIDGTAYPNRFLIHSGYSGGILLDDDFVAKTGLDSKLKITDESSLKDSFGNTIKVKKAVLPTLVVANMRFQDVPTGFFSGALGRQKMSVMGGDVLKRFNLIFDIKNNSLYLMARRT